MQRKLKQSIGSRLQGSELINGVLGWLGGQSATRDRSRRADPLAEGRAFELHSKVVDACAQTLSLLGGAGAKATQQRSALDSVREHLLGTGGRLRELRSSGLPVRDALDRIKLIAFNAGLEGARLGEPAGTPLLLVAEEVRALVERGAEAAEAVDSHIGQLDSEREVAIGELDQARGHAHDIANELLSAGAAGRQLSDEIGHLGTALEQLTGTDPELAKRIGDAARHAQGLLDAIAALSARAPDGGVLRPLTPVISELLRVLSRVADSEAEPGGSAR